jgi:nucleoside-diphosphate-sugar epimerase
MARVLVTGGTGFLGAHCLVQLLAAGHETCATVRDLARTNDVQAMLRQGVAGEVGNRLALFQADLNSDAGWAEAVAGCDYVLHVASPFPSTVPRDENELIAPARDGALRVFARAGRRRPGFPVRGDHRFRWMTTTCSGRWRPGQQGCGRA